MNKKLKAKWIKALRSGRYKQQRDGDLKNEKGYCCLGVLCEVAGSRIKKGDSYLSKAAMKKTGLTEFGNLPDDAPDSYYGVKFSKFSSNTGHSLAAANDKGLSFRSIANLIEKYL